jgi:unsaturated chondroitin disaccharide hydrolase
VAAGDLLYAGLSTYDALTLAAGSSRGVAARLEKQISGPYGTSAEEDITGTAAGVQNATFALKSGTPVSSWAACAAAFHPVFNTVVANDLAYARQKLGSTVAGMPVNQYPLTTDASGNWQTTGPAEWTSGFLPGELWLMYQLTGNTTWKTQAENRQAGIESRDGDTNSMDLGFMLYTSYGNGYRLTGNPQYKQVLLTAAHALATRYSSVVGAIRSLNDTSSEPASDFGVIIDGMLNLNLLWWGAAQSGGLPSWKSMAANHSTRTMQQNVRSDGSTYQLVVYNGNTGAVERRGTVQGYSASSVWSRGQAWAIYGFTEAYEATHNAAYLNTAEHAANWFMAHLPADGVPYWDFDAPITSTTPRDSSAAAVAASGLIELSKDLGTSSLAAGYLTDAKRILAGLSTPRYLSEATSNAAILLHGTYDEPLGSVDTGLTWGDYYFIEALMRYQALEGLGSPIP